MSGSGSLYACRLGGQSLVQKPVAGKPPFAAAVLPHARDAESFPDESGARKRQRRADDFEPRMDVRWAEGEDDDEEGLLVLPSAPVYTASATGLIQPLLYTRDGRPLSSHDPLPRDCDVVRTFDWAGERAGPLDGGRGGHGYGPAWDESFSNQRRREASPNLYEDERNPHASRRGSWRKSPNSPLKQNWLGPDRSREQSFPEERDVDKREGQLLGHAREAQSDREHVGSLAQEGWNGRDGKGDSYSQETRDVTLHFRKSPPCERGVRVFRPAERGPAGRSGHVPARDPRESRGRVKEPRAPRGDSPGWERRREEYPHCKAPVEGGDSGKRERARSHPPRGWSSQREGSWDWGAVSAREQDTPGRRRTRSPSLSSEEGGWRLPRGRAYADDTELDRLKHSSRKREDLCPYSGRRTPPGEERVRVPLSASGPIIRTPSPVAYRPHRLAHGPPRARSRGRSRSPQRRRSPSMSPGRSPRRRLTPEPSSPFHRASGPREATVASRRMVGERRGGEAGVDARGGRGGGDHEKGIRKAGHDVNRARERTPPVVRVIIPEHKPQRPPRKGQPAAAGGTAAVAGAGRGASEAGPARGELPGGSKDIPVAGKPANASKKKKRQGKGWQAQRLQAQGGQGPLEEGGVVADVSMAAAGSGTSALTVAMTEAGMAATAGVGSTATSHPIHAVLGGEGSRPPLHAAAGVGGFQPHQSRAGWPGSLVYAQAGAYGTSGDTWHAAAALPAGEFPSHFTWSAGAYPIPYVQAGPAPLLGPSAAGFPPTGVLPFPSSAPTDLDLLATRDDEGPPGVEAAPASLTGDEDGIDEPLPPGLESQAPGGAGATGRGPGEGGTGAGLDDMGNATDGEEDEEAPPGVGVLSGMSAVLPQVKSKAASAQALIAGVASVGEPSAWGPWLDGVTADGEPLPPGVEGADDLTRDRASNAIQVPNSADLGDSHSVPYPWQGDEEPGIIVKEAAADAAPATVASVAALQGQGGVVGHDGAGMARSVSVLPAAPTIVWRGSPPAMIYEGSRAKAPAGSQQHPSVELGRLGEVETSRLGMPPTTMVGLDRTTVCEAPAEGGAPLVARGDATHAAKPAPAPGGLPGGSSTLDVLGQPGQGDADMLAPAELDLEPGEALEPSPRGGNVPRNNAPPRVSFSMRHHRAETRRVNMREGKVGILSQVDRGQGAFGTEGRWKSVKVEGQKGRLQASGQAIGQGTPETEPPSSLPRLRRTHEHVEFNKKLLRCRDGEQLLAMVQRALEDGHPRLNAVNMTTAFNCLARFASGVGAGGPGMGRDSGTGKGSGLGKEMIKCGGVSADRSGGGRVDTPSWHLSGATPSGAAAAADASAVNGSVRRDPRFLALVDLVSRHLAETPDSFHARELANLIYSPAKVMTSRGGGDGGRGDMPTEEGGGSKEERGRGEALPPALQRLYEVAEATVLARAGIMDEYTGQGLSMLVWGFATLGITAPEVFALVEREVTRRGAPCLGPQSMAMTLWAYGSARVPAPCLLTSVTQHLCATGMAAFQPQEMAMLAWSYARLVGGGAEAGPLRQVEAESLARGLAEFNGQDLANITWAFATVGADAPELFEAVAGEVERRQGATGSLSFLQPQHLAMLVWSFATAKYPAAALFHVVQAEIALRGMSALEAQGLAMLVWAFASAGLGAECGRLFADVDRELSVRSPKGFASFLPQEVAMVTWSYAVTRCAGACHVVEEAAKDVCQRGAAAFGEQDSAMILWAAATVVGCRDETSINDPYRLGADGRNANAGSIASDNGSSDAAVNCSNGITSDLPAGAGIPGLSAHASTDANAITGTDGDANSHSRMSVDHGPAVYGSHRLEAVQDGSSSSSSSSSHRQVAALFDAFLPEVTQPSRLSLLAPQGLAMIAWAYATVRHPGADRLLDAVTQEIVIRRGVAGFKAQDMMMVLWALAICKRPAAALVEVVEKQLVEGKGLETLEFVPQTLSRMLWACASAGVPARTLFQAAEKFMLADAPWFAGCSVQDVTMITWAYASLGFPAIRLFRAAATQVVERRGEGLSAGNLAMLAWSYGKLGYLSESLFDVLAGRMAADGGSIMREVSKRALGMLASAFGSLQATPAIPPFPLIEDECLRRGLDGFALWELGMVARGCANAGYDASRFLDALQGYLLEAREGAVLASAPAGDLVLLLWCCCILERANREFADRVMQAIAEQLELPGGAPTPPDRAPAVPSRSFAASDDAPASSSWQVPSGSGPLGYAGGRAATAVASHTSALQRATAAKMVGPPVTQALQAVCAVYPRDSWTDGVQGRALAALLALTNVAGIPAVASSEDTVAGSVNPLGTDAGITAGSEHDVAAAALPRPARAESTTQSSKLHMEVSRVLRELGVEHDNEVPALFGVYVLDIVVRGRLAERWAGKLCVEVDGPSHYLPDGKMDPTTRLKQRVLEKDGWCVRRVPYKEWQQWGMSEMERWRYLQGLLGME
eukprot:jgi/Mesvir1/18717/Mv16420-RA.1